MIQKGTTPTHIFTTDIDLSSATALYITYKQSNQVKVEKTLADCTVTATQVTVTLTQADTLALDEVLKCKIQIRAKLANGTVVASNVINVKAGEVLKEGEI